MTAMAEGCQLDPDRIPIGVDAHQSWLDLRFSGIENPHVFIAGGSQTGKTTLQILIAAVAASRGNIVIILDPKLRFARAFRHPVTRVPLPNVLVCRDVNDKRAAQEWQGILELAVAEQQSRYEQDDDANSDILDDRRRFPNIYIIADELGVLLDFADKEWPHRRPDDYRGKTPTREMIHVLCRMGAECKIYGVFANQSPREDELPAGTKTRNLCAQRIFLGPVAEDQQWTMLAGKKHAVPDIPSQRGAGAIVFNEGAPIRFQTGLLDWKKHPEQVYELASRGVELLRESGHIDMHDRLYLAGIKVPRPGEMASHVASGFLDLLQETPVTGADIDDPDWAPERPRKTTSEAQQQAQPVDLDPPVNVIAGLTAAAEFCGMSVANFRRVREAHPIEGEIANAKGNKPGWYESDLRVWKMRHAEHRRKRGISAQEGSA